MRRKRGQLERQILEVLWDSGAWLTPAAVGEILGTGLAYTTVVTVLRRLHAKGTLIRHPRGRGHVYAPAMSRDEYAAAAMSEALATTRDPATALNHFVGDLDDDAKNALRRFLGRRN